MKDGDYFNERELQKIKREFETYNHIISVNRTFQYNPQEIDNRLANEIIDYYKSGYIVAPI